VMGDVRYDVGLPKSRVGGGEHHRDDKNEFGIDVEGKDERFMSNHSSLIFDAALSPCSGGAAGPRRSSASRSCSLRSFGGGRKPRSRSAASRFSRETKEFGRLGEW
jgi:hypothetical protein